MYLEIIPKSFTLADSGMFIIGEAKYKFKKMKDLPTDSYECVATLLPDEVEKEYKRAKKVTICFKSLILEGDNTPIGIMNLFYCKVFEPVVKDVSVKEDSSLRGETLDVSEPIIDEERVGQCEILVKDCQKYVGQVWRYDVEDTI